ncbi:Atxe2 family lasso peptide isopeptidase [uncultured Sphingomonas sp.]|uniref:Atxe2 family lasso peptide isopeptidase n=1 Tax=uncultured Sphingomonas sp. TaxID=158754 RepID=UPI0030D8F50D
MCLVGPLLLGWPCISSAATISDLPARIGEPNPPREDSGCSDLLPAGAVPRKPIDARALARIRDVGTVRDYPAGSRPMALSPDRSRVAFVLQRADPDRNAYCFALVVLPLRQGAVPTVIDTGGELITIRDNYLGMADFPTGAQATVEPKWAPDGRSVAFLKRNNGITQIWQAFLDGRPARQLSQSSTDVDQPAWSRDGRSIIYRTRPGLVAARQAIDAEGRRGYLYDARFPALGSATPLPPSNIPYVWMTLRLDDGAVAMTSDADRHAQLDQIEGIPESAVMGTRSGRHTAWAEAVQPNALLPVFRLHVRVADREIPCISDLCVGDLKGIWWLPEGQLIFSRSEGVGNGELAFYRWTPGRLGPRRIMKTDALYISCQSLARGLACLRETPTHPRKVVIIHAGSGNTTTIYDPNPEITGAPHGRVERLTWTDARGGSTFGYLILPPDYRRGQKLPLVVVQYWAKGFQRGGVGDEVPIFPLANNGFAVLSFDRPRERTALIRNHNDDEYMREAMRDWKDRRDVLASLEAGVRLLIDRGIVDPARVGLTGLSDGGETTQFALINSTMFTAASLGTCCKDPLAFTALAGSAQWAAQERWGLRPWTRESQAQWQAASLALNAGRITTPILLQLSDWEFRMSIQTVAEFQRLGRPLELRVFPSEFHIKTQPAHRWALYERNIEWFSRWFKPSWQRQPRPTP